MMKIFTDIQILLKKEFLLEWRQKFALNGILLYVLSTVFVCYLSFNLKRGQLSPATWNALFWIIMLFNSFNAIAKSFIQERASRLLYYYTLCSPEAIILSKLIYNIILMLLLSFLAFGFYSIVMGNDVNDVLMFILSLVMGAIGFASTLTLVSAIASKAQNSATLMTVLGAPLMIPLLLLVIRISKQAIDGLDPSLSYDELITLFAINCIVITLSFVLFPYIWKS